ncbi:MAG: serine/threonine protein kinase [Phycisphaerales bacterium]|nr:serine/threonine protein kinase [Phycisphaerales bacterium]
MSPDRQQRVDELFIEMLELAPADRRARLDDRCGGDVALRDEVESLLAHHEGAGEFLSPSELRDSGLLDDGGTLPAQSRIGEYTVLGVLGSGGMGVVYLAEQERPRRTVALKLIRRLASTPALMRRFEHEAEVLARLQHPGIAHVFSAGTADTGLGPQPYIAMELVKGPPLSEFATRNPIPIPERLGLMMRICDAVQHAHQRGIIHRDLKPGNILVDTSTGAPQPKILDFGVARAVDAEFDVTSLHTSVGQIVGTLAYMSPEQVAAGPGDIDTRSDVYALGVVLFELLTGELPIKTRGRSLPEAARMIRDDPPARLSAIDRAFRGDLDVIVSKALEKDPERRYQSAAELAADLQRHLDGRPIAAKQDSAIYVFRKQIRRYKHFVALGVLALLAVIAFAVFALIQAANESRANLRAQSALLEATTQKKRADETAQKLRAELSASNVEQGRLHGLAGQIGVATDLIWREHLLHPSSDHTFWALWELFSRAPLLAKVQAHDAEAVSVAIAPTGGLVATGDVLGRIRLWEAETLKPRGELTIDAAQVLGLAFRRDGRTLISGDSKGALIAWDLATMKEQRRIVSGHPMIRSVALNPDDVRVLTAGSDGYVREWDIRTGEKLREEYVQRAVIYAAVYDQRGESFATGAGDGVVKVWRDGKSPPVELRGHTDATVGLSFAPDGRLASGSSDRTIRIWDPATGTQLSTLSAPNGYIRNVLFTSDGSDLYSAGWWTIDTWDVAAAKRARVWPVQIRPGMIAISADDQRLYSALPDGTLEVWEMRRQPAAITLAGHSKRATASMSADGRLAGTADMSGAVRLWDASDGRLLAKLDAHKGGIRNILLAPDGAWFATGAEDFNLRLWDARTGAMLSEAKRFEGGLVSCRSIVYEPRRGILIWSGVDRAITLARVPTLEVVARLPAAKLQLVSLKLSPDGNTLISINRGDEVKVWDVDAALAGRYSQDLKPELIPVRTGPQAQPWTSAFSPDGRLLLLGDWTKSVQIWDFPRRLLLGHLEGHTALVYDVAFMPGDADKVATSSADGTIKLWSLRDRRCLLTIDPFGGWDAITVEFTPDGRRLMSASADGTVKIWDLHHFDRHIAGSLEYALGRYQAELGGQIDAEALRAWARGIFERKPEPPQRSTGPDLGAIAAWGRAQSERP